MKFVKKNIELYYEDNIALMQRYEDNYFDLASVDIEYGIGASSPNLKPGSVKQKNGGSVAIKQAGYKAKEWDFKKSTAHYFKELFRVSKNQIIWGANYYNNLPGGRIVWDKGVAVGADQYGCEIAYQSFNNRMDIVYYLFHGMMQGVYCGKDKIKALKQIGDKRLNEKRIHPTQKPVKLYEWLLKKYCKQGFKIIDTHSGSASQVIAVDRINKIDGLNLQIVACENEKDYFTDSVKRVKEATQWVGFYQ